MERYGSSWEEYITLIFLSEDPSGLSGQLYLAQLAWGRGGKSRITVVHCSRYCTQNFTKDWSCQMLRASVPALKDVLMGLNAAQRPMLGCGTYLPGKAVTSELAILHT